MVVLASANTMPSSRKRPGLQWFNREAHLWVSWHGHLRTFFKGTEAQCFCAVGVHQPKVSEGLLGVGEPAVVVLSAGEGSPSRPKARGRLVKEPAIDQGCEPEAWGSLHVCCTKCGLAMSTEWTCFHLLSREKESQEKTSSRCTVFLQRKGLLCRAAP